MNPTFKHFLSEVTITPVVSIVLCTIAPLHHVVRGRILSDVEPVTVQRALKGVANFTFFLRVANKAGYGINPDFGERAILSCGTGGDE